MDRRNNKRNPSTAGALTPGVIVTLALVGAFAILLTVVALVRGAM